MIVLNFSHRLSNEAIQKLRKMLHDYVNGTDLHIRTRELKLRIDFDKSLSDQIVAAVNEAEEGVRLDGEQIFIISPGISDAAILLAVEIHGRSGDYPHLILMKRDDETKRFLPYGILDCSRLRAQARGRDWRSKNVATI